MQYFPISISQNNACDTLNIKSFSSFPTNVIYRIICNLDFKSLLQFEIVSRNFAPGLNSSRSIIFAAWQQLKVKDNLNYTWKMCRNERLPPKWEYRLSRALYQYILVHKFPKVMHERFARIIRFKYIDLMIKFPILKAYIGVDIYRLYKSKNKYLYYVCKKERKKLYKKCYEGATGEKLLMGLILTRSHNFSKPESIKRIEELFYETMNVSATHASLYALQLNAPYEQIESMTISLALRAAKYNDYRAINQLMDS